MASPLSLIANPGSASRKYALYQAEQERAALHFELSGAGMCCTMQHHGRSSEMAVDIPELTAVAGQLEDFLRIQGLLHDKEQIDQVGLRIVAPVSYFLQDHSIDSFYIDRLQEAEPRAPLHISATLAELRALKEQFGNAAFIGVSDSAFHVTKPDYAWNYGIPLDAADRFEIKRFGYHGLSIASVVHTLAEAGKLPPKTVVCHIGSGVSVTALHGGQSLDTTIGYSPLEGAIMATRSGSIDPTAVSALKDTLQLDDTQMEEYLNKQSGLLGLAGSSDMRELLRRESDGDHIAHLAIKTYVYALQKAVGQMTAALGGIDALVFTGTIGERASPIRQRIVQRLHYLDLLLDDQANSAGNDDQSMVCISRLAHSKPVYIVAANETLQMMQRIQQHAA